MESVIIKYNWQEKGLCRIEKKFIPETGEHVPYSPNDFYTESGKKVTEEVKKMCRRCPVKDECLGHALAHEKYGEWGGVSERKRRIIRRNKNIKFISPQSNS